VLTEQQAAGVNDLEDILKAYIDRRLGEHGQRAAYPQLEGLKALKKPRGIKCFEWEVLFATANDVVDWVPGPEPKLTDETLRRAYLDSYPRKWTMDFEKVKTSDMGATTMSAITAYMTDMETNSAAAQLENEHKQKTSKTPSSKANPSWTSNNKKNKKDHSDKHKKKREWVGPPQDDKQCRLHPYSGHSWKDCNQHPSKANKKPKMGKKPGSEDNHMIVEPGSPILSESGSDNEQSSKKTKKSSGKCRPRTSSVLPTVLPVLPDESHHLDCFALHHLEPKSPLIPSSTMSTTTMKGSPSCSSLRSVQERVISCGTRDTLDTRSEAMASNVERLTRELFEEQTANEYNRGNSENKIGISVKQDLIPSTVLVAALANGVVSKRPIKVLLDSGSTSNFIYRNALPTACKPKPLKEALPVTLLEGTATVDQEVIMSDVVLSELSHTKHIKEIKCYLAPGKSNYDMIIGRTTLRNLEIILDFKTNTIEWMGSKMAMKPPITRQRMSRFHQMQEQFLASFEDEDDELAPGGIEDNFFTTTRINESKYERKDVDECVPNNSNICPRNNASN